MIELPLMTLITEPADDRGARITGLMLFAPFFGSAVIPARIKAIFVFATTLLLFPTVGARGSIRMCCRNWPVLVFTEFLIGAGMGIATNIVFDLLSLRARSWAFRWAIR